MEIQNQTLDFINEVKAKPYHMKDNDFGDFIIKKIIKLSDDFYMSLDYSGHLESYHEELKAKGKYTPLMLFSLYFLEKDSDIKLVISDHDYINRFDFGLDCLSRYISAIDENHGKTLESIVTINQMPFSKTSLGFYSDSDDISLNHINFDEEPGIAKAILLTSDVVFELYDIFKILSSFSFYIDELTDDNNSTKDKLPEYQLEEVSLGNYLTISATWNGKDYLPSHQILKYYEIDEITLKNIYKEHGEYFVDWFNSDSKSFISIEFLNKMNILKNDRNKQ